MLTNAKVNPTLPAVDLDRARKFYEDKLGLKVIREDQNAGLLLQAGEGTTLYLYKRAPTKADHTVVEFDVDNLESEVKELRNKGVKFEDYDIPEMRLKTVNGIAELDGMKSAWFKDTEGNILGMAEMAKVAQTSSMKETSSVGGTTGTRYSR